MAPVNLFVIGLVGEKGGGKGTFAQILAEETPSNLRCVRVRFSDLLRETLHAWALPVTRANLQNLSRIMVQTYGNGTLAQAIAQRISRTAAHIVVLDGVRWEEDRALVRSFSQHLLVYVTADPHMRYARIRSRGENADDTESGFATFMAEERAVAEQDIVRIGATADITIRNEETVAELRAHARRVLVQALTPHALKK